MNIEQFKQLHKNLKICVSKTIEHNPLPSATDPTQDIPIRMIEVNAMGVPLNVKEHKPVMNNLKVEQMTSIEKRNNDAFDNLGELQDLSAKVAQKGVTTNFIKPKKQKKHEE